MTHNYILQHIIQDVVVCHAAYLVQSMPVEHKILYVQHNVMGTRLSRVFAYSTYAGVSTVLAS